MSVPQPVNLKIVVIPVTGFQQNCSLVFDEQAKLGAVVDPGGDVDRILEQIEKHQLTIEKIVLTHGHIDHAGGALTLKERLQSKERSVPIEGPHEADRFLLQQLAAQGAAYGVLGARDVLPDRWLDEGQELQIAGASFKILHCPGHSPGSLVYVNEAQRFALMGDVLFRGSIGRTDFPYGDHDALIRAIHEKILPLGDDLVFICGHGPASTIGAERQDNPYIRSTHARVVTAPRP